MDSIIALVSPDEVNILKIFIAKLRDGSLSDKERKDSVVSFHPLDVARRIIAFYIARKDKGIGVAFGGRNVNMEYFSEMAKNDRTLFFLLNEGETYVDEMLEDYYRILVSSPRHYVLNKSLKELTGYDIHKIISYVAEDTKIE